jgi:catechol 2,3-dioxygenase-like lactoylglutathione lyase family enzyme
MGSELPTLVSRLNVVYLYVRDVTKSRAFYRDLLGIPLEGDEHWQEADLGGTRFALHKWHEGVGEPSSGTVHLSFEVADLEDAVRLLREAGVEPGAAMRDIWGAAAEVIDPDGYRVHLFEPPG